MSEGVRAAEGNGPNDAYCERLVELAFPEVVRIAGQAFGPSELLAELKADGLRKNDLEESVRREYRALLECISKRFFLGSGLSPEEIVAKIFRNEKHFGDTLYTEETLRKAIPDSPKLQQVVAARTHYVPSKWLLEQEMIATGAWPPKAVGGAMGAPPTPSADAEDVYRTVAAQGLMGVCFSGGGIRSATFGLGVIQGLAQLGLLPWIDYLSSVSGGGYIHEFLAAWILRHPQGRDGVILELVPQAEPGCLPRSSEPIKWLMRYASYLTPARGMFSTDTWTLVAIWVRNTILNQIPIVFGLACAFFTVHLLVLAPVWGRGDLWKWGGGPEYGLHVGMGLAGILVLGSAYLSLIALNGNLRLQLYQRSGGSSGSNAALTLLDNWAVQWRLITPWLGLSLWLTYWVQFHLEGDGNRWLGWFGYGLFFLWVGATVMVVMFSGGLQATWEDLHPNPDNYGMTCAKRSSTWSKASYRLTLEKAVLKRRIARLKPHVAQAVLKHPTVMLLSANVRRKEGMADKAWQDYQPDYKKWSRARALFVLGGLGATLVAGTLGLGFVLGMEWAACRISEWMGSLDAAKSIAEQSLKFSVSGVAQNFSATLAGSLSSAKDTATGLHIDPWRIQLVFLPGLLLSIPFVAIELTLGLLGRDFADMRREWLARLRAWSLLYAMLWAGLVAVTLLGPYLGYWLAGRSWALWSSVATFVTAHLTTIFTGWSSKADGKPSDKGWFGLKPLDFLALVAAPVSVLGILLSVSCAASVAVDSLAVFEHTWIPLISLSDHSLISLSDYIRMLSDPLSSRNFLAADSICVLVALIVGVLFGWRVDINDFSMLSFYRNRLSRCYLGATVNARQPDPFTGFDGRGDIKLANGKSQKSPPTVFDLLPTAHRSVINSQPGNYQGPFPIFCTTLNLTTGADLATQERKGTSFAFTPLYSGYSVSWTDADISDKVSYNGYVPTERYAYVDGGIHLDTAVAISGAAVNPNMGFNSNPALSFLMTFLNVRLGWWISNTRKKDKWAAGANRVTPKFAAWNLFQELIGKVDDAAEYVNLSDGGHFENMGLYELVRRRCRYILVCDAEGDAQMTFEGIGGAISKCRADFGAEIDLDLRPLRLDEKTGYSQTHCVVGTIKYPPPPEDWTDNGGAVRTGCGCMEPEKPKGANEDNDRYTGVIVYMKSSLVGDEPADLLSYKLRHPVFPHDSTGNQWFQESQFEAYRRLGHHVAMSALQPALPPLATQVPKKGTGGAMEELFRQMYAIWYPRTPEMESHLAEHLRQYEDILKELRTSKLLEGLEALLFDSTMGMAPLNWISANLEPGALMYGTQFANSLLEFMAKVYINLELAFPDNRVSPHAEWWICLFRRWCRVDVVRRAWTVYSASLPLEFQLFARRELGLV